MNILKCLSFVVIGIGGFFILLSILNTNYEFMWQSFTYTWTDIEDFIRIDFVTAGILLSTFLIVSLYTEITRRLWKESKSQTYQLISPCIVFNIERRTNVDYRFTIENLGKGVAFNIILEDFIVHTLDLPKTIFRLVFNEIDTLKSGEKVELGCTEYRNGKEVDISLLSDYLNPAYQSKKNFIFVLTYYNVSGDKYFTKFQTGKDGVRTFPKGIGKYSFWKKRWFWIQRKTKEYKNRIITLHKLKKERKKLNYLDNKNK